MKRIIICADGTWNRPERDPDEDTPTNVLKTARAIAPVDEEGNDQVVFYDWGIGTYGSFLEKKKGGAFGEGINKNIMDCYRFIVQNYNPGDELYFFGFSRGAYTVRSLAGFINNCSILKREYAGLIEIAYELYKDSDIHPKDAYSVDFRQQYSAATDVRIRFIGVWDTVGALGIPGRMFGFLNEEHLFHDNKIGPNIDCARHALAIDEMRSDFEPTIWKKRKGMDLLQVWFAGVHADIGGGYRPEGDAASLSDIPLKWMIAEAQKQGLVFERHLEMNLHDDPMAEQHQEYEGFFKVLGKHERTILKKTRLHKSVEKRYTEMPNYRPKKLVQFVGKYGWMDFLTE